MTSNIDLEQVVLGSLLINPEGARVLAHGLEPQDFSIQEHQILFQTILDLTAAGHLPHPTRIIGQLAGVRFAKLTSAEYIARLLTVAEPDKIVADHIQHLRQLTARRKMVEMSHVLLETAQNMASEVRAATAEVVASMDEINARMRGTRQSGVLAPIEARTAVELLRRRETPDFIKTGLSDADKYLGGWHRGELHILAGRPSMGKSAALFSTLRRAAQLGTTSIIFSLEMRREAVMQRMLSDAVWNPQTPIDYVRIARQNVTDYEIERLEEVSASMEAYAPLHIDDQAALTCAEIAARARRFKEELERQGKTLDVLAVDHIGKIAASDRYKGNKVHETGEKTSALAVLGRELNVAVIAAHQLSRAVELRDEKRPGLSDLRDSGDVEQDADTVIFIYRAAYYLERMRYDDPDEESARLALLQAKQHDQEWIIAKNRNGPCVTLELYADMASNVVRDRRI